ncbi:hypothetical protein PWY87_31090 [Kribbella solani]|uniref:hypothetical protein n=1 Tax=Kribbella solani TaxID=236067 RepID=UPI0029AFC75C|nr:hypothetical protein [Kribbella solani]MDX3006163.1 hypothetical protein [Kribbella solani]
MGGFTRRALVLAAILLPGALSVLGVLPAAAHPFGDPQTVAISTSDSVVKVRWKVGGLDDLTLLGVVLGVLPQDRVMLDGAVSYQPADGTAMGSSPKLTEYLLRQITVTSHGKDCPGAVQPIVDLAKSGASIEYTCRSAVGAVAVTVKTLTDLNPAYKTLATGPGGARAVYGAEDDEHEWNAGAGSNEQLGRSAVPQFGAVADRLERLVHSPGVPPVAFLLAFAAGAGHAVMPGHGKSLAAAYLLGGRGRVRDAAWLGGSVAIMHTLSVLAIGVAWTFLSLSNLIRLESLTTGLQLLAGLLVVTTGLWLLKHHKRTHTHTHGHGHGHGHGRGHGAAYAGGGGRADGGGRGRGSRPGLVLLGISGGLTPSPSAFLVLVAGLFLGRAGFALLLVVTFGVGMAVVLFGVGLLAVAGSSVVVRGGRSHRLFHLAGRVAPLVAAGGITLAGITMTAYAAVQLLHNPT